MKKKKKTTQTPQQILNTLSLLTAKPLIFLLNLSEEDFIKKKNKWLPKVPLRNRSEDTKPCRHVCLE